MREDRIGPAAHDPTEVEDVEIDLPGAVHAPIHTSHPLFDALQRRKQRPGRAAPGNLRDGILELGLIGAADGIRPVEGGDPQDSERSETFQEVERSLDRATPIAEIGAEPEVDPRP